MDMKLNQALKVLSNHLKNAKRRHKTRNRRSLWRPTELHERQSIYELEIHIGGLRRAIKRIEKLEKQLKVKEQVENKTAGRNKMGPI